MLKNLGWESYVNIVEDTFQTTNLLEALANLSDGRICPVEKPIMLPKSDNSYTTVYKELMESKMYSNVYQSVINYLVYD